MKKRTGNRLFLCAAAILLAAVLSGCSEGTAFRSRCVRLGSTSWTHVLCYRSFGQVSSPAVTLTGEKIAAVCRSLPEPLYQSGLSTVTTRFCFFGGALYIRYRSGAGFSAGAGNPETSPLALFYWSSHSRSTGEIFPDMLVFVSPRGESETVYVNHRYATFDKRHYFPHNLTDEEYEAFLLSASRVH